MRSLLDVAQMRGSIVLAFLMFFVLAPCTATQAWTLKTLHSFCAQPGCKDGRYVTSGLVSDPRGNLYGVAQGGGGNEGIVFALIPNDDRSDWTYTVIHEFCTTAKRRCRFGAEPAGRLIVDVNGNLYGVTQYGGTESNGGTVYELTPDSGHTIWTFTRLHSFCGQQCTTERTRSTEPHTWAASIAPGRCTD
jgi:uncharacterized repeat protein (TIGR03803 family)